PVAMECRDKAAVPPRKLVQARLPFKRLNPVPREKLDVDPEVKKAKSSPGAFIPSKDPSLDTSGASLDNVENDCQLGSDGNLTPKLVNGKGPLDHFIQKNPGGDTSDPGDLPDLPKGSGHGLGDSTELGDAGPRAAATDCTTGKELSCLNSRQGSPAGNSGEAEGSPAAAAAQAEEDSGAGIQPHPGLTPCKDVAGRKGSQGELKDLLFEGKVPVVLLEDIMSLKSPQVASLDSSATSGNEALESSHEGDSGLSHSSLSSGSSPEVLLVAQPKRSSSSPLAASTPARKVGLLCSGAQEVLWCHLGGPGLVGKRINAQKAEITRFFQKPKTPQAPKTLAGSCGKFAPFEIKENMVLAPLSRVALDPDYLEQLDKLLHAQNAELSFLRELKHRKPRKTGPTLVNDSSDSVNSDVVVVDTCQSDAVPEREKFGRMKLLQFSENHRPAYWGTWNKRTPLIRARNPWSKDTKLLDYEVDSDEEWEEEEPGESLSHSEEDDEEEGEDEDEDDGFFVPHGYLSEDEGVTEECDPENQKVRQKLKAKEWDELIAKGKRFHVLQPVKIGCVWERAAAKDSSTNTDLKVLQQFTACVLEPPVPEEEQQTQKCSKKRAKDQQILAHLLPLLHGNVHGSKVIIQEFQECCRRGRFSDVTEGSDRSPPQSQHPLPPPGEDSGVPSKARLKRIISESSVYEKRPEFRMCWYVHAEVLRSFGHERLPVPCQWSYVTQVPCTGREEGTGTGTGLPVPQPAPPAAKRKATTSMSITKFMKRPRDAEQVSRWRGVCTPGVFPQLSLLSTVLHQKKHFFIGKGVK
uniref:Chromatin assembly factor 1 subunit A n=1 Tax=Zosterops lateralis melanops TaxID=1220523 RepID=A0A8D2PNF3_ZOSLA